MAALIIRLLPDLPQAGTEYSYVVTSDGFGVALSGQCGAASLPLAHGQEVVALVPLEALSWHTVSLPARLKGPHLRSALVALLEDQLLEDAAFMHLALAPDDGPTRWVAACRHAWLQGHLQHLAQNRVAVVRVVPEFEPGRAGHGALYAIDSAEGGQFVCCDAQRGVLRLPMCEPAVQWLAWPDDAPASAEPAVLARAQDLLGHDLATQTSGQRSVVAARSDWNLAQFDLGRSLQTRGLRMAEQAWAAVWHGAAWRGARWLLLLFVCVQVVGLNAVAWRERTLLEHKRQSMRGILTETFPEVTLVIDAQLQMQRQLAMLRQATGMVSAQDLEALLDALVPGPALQDIEYSSGQLRLRGIRSNPEETAAVSARLQKLGYALQVEGNTWLLQPEEAK